MSSIQPYKIVFNGDKEKIEAAGPLLIDSRGGYESGKLDVKYSIQKIEVFSLHENKLIESLDNYLVFETNSSGPILSWTTEKEHGKFPFLSKQIKNIVLFEQHNEVVSVFTSENSLKWDKSSRVLLICSK